MMLGVTGRLDPTQSVGAPSAAHRGEPGFSLLLQLRVKAEILVLSVTLGACY